MRNSQQILIQIWKYIIINVAYYMFRPLIVVIFREVLFEDYTYPFSEDGHNRWPKHAACYAFYNAINLRIRIAHVGYFS